jgi:outer membrane protease
MKRIFLLVLVFVGAISLLSAQHAAYLPRNNYQIDEDWLTLSISLDSGMFFGMLYEYVFIDRDADGYYNGLYSKLDWQLNPLIYSGFTMQAEMWEQMVIGLGFWLGIPGLLGTMEDRDWDDDGDYIKFSHHDNYLMNAIFADINIGYNVIKNDVFVFSPLIGFNYKHILMSGRDGYAQYPPTDPPKPASGDLIHYEQNYYVAYFGFQTSWAPVPLFSMQLFCSYSPMVFGFNIDNHLSKNMDYIDIPVWGHYVYINAAIFFHIINELSVKLHGSFSWIPVFKGNIYAKKSSEDTYALYSNGRGGGSLIMGGINISIVLNQ